MKDSFQNHVDDFFRNMLQSHKKEPGKHVWENIEKELDKDEQAALLERSKAGFRKAGGLLLLIFFLGSSILYYRTHQVQSERPLILSGQSKSAAGNSIRRPAKTFPNIVVLKESGIHSVDLKYVRYGNTEISAPDF